jgi:hypothetical protein
MHRVSGAGNWVGSLHIIGVLRAGSQSALSYHDELWNLVSPAGIGEPRRPWRRDLDYFRSLGLVLCHEGSPIWTHWI